MKYRLLFLALLTFLCTSGRAQGGAPRVDRLKSETASQDSTISEADTGEAMARFQTREAGHALEMEKVLREREVEQARARTRLFVVIGIDVLLVLLIGLLACRRLQLSDNRIEEQQVQLAGALAERETLLREVHHRVKNNLQVISGLLQKQALVSSSEAVKSSLREGRERLQAMALVHQKLYQQDALQRINVREFIVELAELIKESNAANRHIEMKLDVADVDLDLDRAIPLGLILNELISNAYKYAFAGRDSGKLGIAFNRESGKDCFYLTVEDDGAGLPGVERSGKRSGLGLRLVTGLARQLEGSCLVKNKPAGGVRAELWF